MPSHLDSCMTTDIKPDMLSGVQTGNGIPHDRYNRYLARAYTTLVVLVRIRGTCRMRIAS